MRASSSSSRRGSQTTVSFSTAWPQRAELCEAVKIRIVLDPHMRHGDLYAESIAELLSCKLHGVQHNVTRTLADAVDVKIQSFLVQFLKDLSELLRIEGRGCR